MPPDSKWDIKFNKPLVISEFGGGALQGLHGTIEEGWTEEYQEYLYQQNLKMIERIPRIRGTSPWILADFRSPKRLLPGIRDGWNRKGLVSGNGIKKRAFYTFRSFYDNIIRNMNRNRYTAHAAVALLILAGSVMLLSCQETKRTAPKGYKLVWSDEFDYSGKPDSLKWGYELGFIRNNEKQYYTDSLKNVRVENGYLIIEAQKEKIANTKYGSDEFSNKPWLQYIAATDTAEYTSGSIMTQGLAEWTYGFIEVSARLPQGVGLWPAIWMLGTNRTEVGWPRCGEIDIMEHVGFNKDSIFGTIHTGAYNHTKGTQKGEKVFIDDPYNKFHLFALEWTPEKMDFLLDGQVYNHIENEHKTTEEWPFDQNFFLKLNVAIGGGLGGRYGIDDAVFPQKMVIDYVRVYQMK